MEKIVPLPNVDADLNTDYKYLIGKLIIQCLQNVRQPDYFVQSTLKYFHCHIHKLRLNRQELFRIYNCLKGVLRYLRRWTNQNYKLDIAVLLDVSVFEVSSNYSGIKFLVDQMLNYDKDESKVITINTPDRKNNYLIGLFTQHHYINNTLDMNFEHLHDQREFTVNIPKLYTLLTDKWIKFRAICGIKYTNNFTEVNANDLMMPKHYLNTIGLMLGVDMGPRLTSFTIPQGMPSNIFMSRWMNDIIQKIINYGCDVMFLVHQFKDSYVPEVDMQFCYLTLYQLSYHDDIFRKFHYDWKSNDYPFISGLLCTHQDLMLDMTFVVQMNKTYDVIEHLLPEPDYFQLQKYDPIFEALSPWFIYLPDEDIMRNGRDLFLYRAVKAYVWRSRNKLTIVKYIQAGLIYDYHYILREYGPIVLRKLMKNDNYIIACPYYNLFKQAKWSEISSLIFEQQCHHVNGRSELLEWLYIFTVLEHHPDLNNELDYANLLENIIFERCSPMVILFRSQLLKIMNSYNRRSIIKLTEVSTVAVCKKFKNQNIFTCMVQPRKVKYDFDTNLQKTKKDKFVILPYFDLEVSNETMFKLIDMYVDTDLFAYMIHVIKIIWSQDVFRQYLSKISKIKSSLPDHAAQNLIRYNKFVNDYIDIQARKKNLRKTILRMMDEIDKLLASDAHTIKQAAMVSEYKIIRAKMNAKIYSMDAEIRNNNIKNYNTTTTLNNVNTTDIERSIEIVKERLKQNLSVSDCKDCIALLLRSYDNLLIDPAILEYKKFLDSLEPDNMRKLNLTSLLNGYHSIIQRLQNKCERRINKLMNRQNDVLINKLGNISTAEQLKKFIIKNYAFIVDHPNVEQIVNEKLNQYNVLE